MVDRVSSSSESRVGPQESPVGRTSTVPITSAPAATGVQADVVTLGDNTQILRSDFNTLPADLQQIALSEGLTAVNEAIATRNKEASIASSKQLEDWAKSHIYRVQYPDGTVQYFETPDEAQKATDAFNETNPDNKATWGEPSDKPVYPTELSTMAAMESLKPYTSGAGIDVVAATKALGHGKVTMLLKDVGVEDAGKVVEGALAAINAESSYKVAADKLKDYKTGDNQYDIYAAIANGVSRDDIDALFGQGTYDKAKVDATTRYQGQQDIYDLKMQLARQGREDLSQLLESGQFDEYNRVVAEEQRQLEQTITTHRTAGRNDLADLLESGKFDEYNEQIAQDAAGPTVVSTSDSSAESFIQYQIDTYGISEAEAKDRLDQVQSGKYLAYDPEVKDFVPVWADFVAQREALGLTPQQLDEIYSNQFRVPNDNYNPAMPASDDNPTEISVTQSQYEEYKAAQAEVESLIANPAFPQFLADAYKTGGLTGFNKAVQEFNTTMNQASAAYPVMPILTTQASSALLHSVVDTEAFQNSYAEMLRPQNITDSQWNTLKPFIKPSGTDIKGAIDSGVSEDYVSEVTGLDSQAIQDAVWSEKFSNANWFQQQAMLVKDRPAEYAKAIGSIAGEAALLAIPLVGTEYMMTHQTKFKPWEVGLSGALDMLVVLPEFKAVGVAIKQGISLPRAFVQSGMRVARGTVYPLVHPIETVKSVVRMPVNITKMILSGRNQPLATVFRGSYMDGASIAKVLAGNEADALKVRAAMEDQFRLIVEGKKADGAVDIPGYGTLHFSSTGIHKDINNLVFTATPMAPTFKGVGVKAKGQGIFVADQALLGLESMSATGTSAVYVAQNKKVLRTFRSKDIIGTIGESGEFLGMHGTSRGQLQIGSKLQDLKGKRNLRLRENGVVTTSSGSPVGIVKSGAVWTDNPEVIGRYYKDTIEMFNNAPHTINADGKLIDSAGNVVGNAKPKIIGTIPEGTKVVGETGKVIGWTVSQPAFVMIHTAGVNTLPDNVANADNMKDMERLAWKAFETNKATQELYPVFKQYRIFMEDEGLIPKNNVLIPVLDGKGKPFMMTTTDQYGRTIEMPMLQMASKDWFEKSKTITQSLKSLASKATPKMTPEDVLANIKNIPDAKTAAPLIAQWFRNNPDARLVGSTVEYLYTAKYIPADIDMGARNPARAAREIADIIERQSGVKVRVPLNKDGTARIEWFSKKADGWVEAANVKNIGKGYSSSLIKGVRFETPSAQVERTYTRMMDEFGDKGYTRWKRYGEALGGGTIDIGIGAKPPSRLALRKLQARGIWNTVRDLFVPTLTLEKKLDIVDDIAPDLKNSVKNLSTAEDRIESLRAEYNMARRVGARVSVKQISALRQSLIDSIKNYTNMRNQFEDEIYVRAYALSQIDARIPRNLPAEERSRVVDMEAQRYFDAQREERAKQTYVPRSDYYRGTEEYEIRSTRMPDRTYTERPQVERVEPERLRSDRPEQERPREARYIERPRIDRVETERPREVRYVDRRDVRTPRVQYDADKYRITPPYERVRGDIRKDGPRPHLILPSATDEGTGVKVPDGSITWKQGFVWKYIPPPWTQDTPISLRLPPIGAKNTQLNTPEATVQMIGQATSPVPESTSIDLGVVDVFVTNSGQNIYFAGKGRQTNVGRSIASNTSGMSLNRGYKRSSKERNNGIMLKGLKL